MRHLIVAVLLMLALPSAGLAEGKWVGAPAPVLRLPDQDGKLRSVADFKGQWIALYFYPKDNTPGCTQEAKRFRDRWADFRKAGIMVIGASLDGVASHKRFATDLGLPFPLLADEKHELASAMGVLRGMGPLRHAGRETFLIDPEGTIVYHYPDVDTARHAEQVLQDVARLSAKSAARH
ncbi:MAG: peroxiredoxin [Moraxellaceae bacterium]|jgi:peroxiredoxin Q/BCP|nr:peroxiredoxin [Moraxellaceae bacterium]